MPESVLNRVSALANEFKLANLRPQIAACESLMQTRNGIDVAVFGRFKAGKSSFLNHLVGRDVLPIGVVPLTAVVTRLRCGPEERAEVHFLNGTGQTIPLGDIGLYVGEKENPTNRKQIASVEVELPALERFAPLQLVDTPGLGSMFVHNTAAALNWLPNVGAALVAVSADAPLSERDQALVEDLRRHTPRIVLLLTKADLLTEPQRAEVLAFVREQVRRQWNEDLPTFFYSIKPELAELKVALERNLLDPLRRDRATTTGEILRHKLNSLAGQTLDYLRVALAAATQAESARRALIERLAEELRQFDALREELHLLAHNASGEALERSLAQLKPVERALQVKVTAELAAQFEPWRMRTPALIAAYGEWLDAWMARELTAVSDEQRATFCDPLHKARARLARSLRAYQDRLAQHVQTALGLKLAPHEFVFELPQPESPPVDVSTQFLLPMDILGYVIPMTLFRRVVEGSLLRRARYEVEKNLSRLAASWQQRVSTGIAQLRQQAEQAAGNELTALEQMATVTSTDESRLCGLVGKIERLRAGLSA